MITTMWRHIVHLLLISVVAIQGVPQPRDYKNDDPAIVTTGVTTTTESTTVTPTCPAPFELDGDQCLYFASFAEETRQECSQICHSLGGELAGIRTPTQLKQIIDLIKSHGLQEKSFWIDGTDVESESIWLFASGGFMPMGTPFWAASEATWTPDDVEGTQNCADITPEQGFLINDENCTKLRSPLCEYNMTATMETDVMSSRKTLDFTCPPFYLPIGEMCLAFVTWAEQRWLDSSQTCHGMGGELASINDIEILRKIYKYLNSEGITGHSFWIGGSDEEKESHWVWKDSWFPVVPMGTPFWGNRPKLSLPEPDGGTKENCLALTTEGAHYFRDKDCAYEINPLCSIKPL